MNFYNEQRPMNRQERRKNGIQNEGTKRNYSRKDFEKIEGTVRQELTNLMSESYSDTMKRQRYARLQPLIKEYEKQKEYFDKQPQTAQRQETQIQAMEAYNREREKLANNSVYQKLNTNRTVRRPSTANTTYRRTQRAVSAYQAQTSYARPSATNTISDVRRQTANATYQPQTSSSREASYSSSAPKMQKVTPTRKQQAKKKQKKKGFFARFMDLFKTPAPAKAPQKVSKPKTVPSRTTTISKTANQSATHKRPNTNRTYTRSASQRRNISRPNYMANQRYRYVRDITTEEYLNSNLSSYEQAWDDFARALDRQNGRTANSRTYQNRGRDIGFER